AAKIQPHSTPIAFPIRRFLRVTRRHTIVVRVWIDRDDLSFFTGTSATPADVPASSGSSRLHAVITAIKPLVYRRLREQRYEKGVSLARAVAHNGSSAAGDGADGTRKRQTTLDSVGSAASEAGAPVLLPSTTATTTELRYGAIGKAGIGDLAVHAGVDGWECAVFLTQNSGRSSTLLVKEMKASVKRKWKRGREGGGERGGGKRRKGIIEIQDEQGQGEGWGVREVLEIPDSDGGEYAEDMSKPTDSAADEEEEKSEDEDEDVKPQMQTTYTGYDINGKEFYLVLRRLRRTNSTSVAKAAMSEKLRDLFGPGLDDSDSGSDAGSGDGPGAGVEVHEEEATDSGIIGWISASQGLRANDGIDFEAK
ncbi:uncharacterized protein V1518DRAFT_137417, partial [Limtongia smithiae]|uniref:uncharacterized protein n=1 Tax=Limtongia smithiae TaxID=1125753 RepID=UPI0034CEF8B7